jgi:hypothetical protein
VELNRRRLMKRLPTLLAIAGTTVSLGLIAMASQRRAPRHQPGSGVPGLLKNLGVALVVVYVAIAIYVVFAAGIRRSRPQTSRTRSDWASAAGLVAVVLLVTLVVTKLRRSGNPKIRAIFTTSVPGRDQPPLPKVTTDAPVTWGWQLGLGLVALIAVVSLVLAMRSRRLRQPPPPPVDRRTLVAVSLNDLLTELDRENDPRRAVLLADRGMEVALAEHGLPRATTETANEYGARVAEELSLSNTSAHTLTQLYALAHFSSNELRSTDRDAAIDALRSVRDELRAMPVVDSNA